MNRWKKLARTYYGPNQRAIVYWDELCAELLKAEKEAKKEMERQNKIIDTEPDIDACNKAFGEHDYQEGRWDSFKEIREGLEGKAKK